MTDMAVSMIITVKAGDVSESIEKVSQCCFHNAFFLQVRFKASSIMLIQANVSLNRHVVRLLL